MHHAHECQAIMSFAYQELRKKKKVSKTEEFSTFGDGSLSGELERKKKQRTRIKEKAKAGAA